jgi:hypothetical protein
MSTSCQFDSSNMQFAGMPLEQARCLLRFPKVFGNVDDGRATIPATLAGILSDINKLGFTKTKLRAVLAKRGIAEANIGGSLDRVVSRANNNDESKSSATYFAIHDTSNLLDDDESFDAAFINSSQWAGNHLENLTSEAHVFITRNGRTKTTNDYQTPSRATRFEMEHVGSDNPTIHKGRFLHHELVQPRRPKSGVPDADSPKPGFTASQYELLAICYLAASLRRGSWLIPVLHCVLDLGVGDHDDPQNFDLGSWDQAIAALMDEMAVKPPASTTNPLRSKLFKDDPTLQKVVRGQLTLVATGDTVAGIGPVQDALNQLAATQPELRIELNGNRGFFGPRTKNAVAAFQKLRSLPETGKVDAATLLLLNGLVL